MTSIKLTAGVCEAKKVVIANENKTKTKANLTSPQASPVNGGG